MSASFPTVQSNTAIGPFVGDPTISFTSAVSFGNILLVSWSNSNVNGFGGQNPPTTVTDNLGNNYQLWGQSQWFNANVVRVSQLWIAQGNGASIYGGVIGGLCTITFHGAIGGDANGPSIIICEKETPEFYSIFAVQAVDTNNSHISFRSTANNGSPGGGDSSDTGLVQIECQPNGNIEEFVDNATCVVALINQFIDVTLVMVNFNDYDPLVIGPWTLSGNMIGYTLENPIVAGPPAYAFASAVMSDQDFPYLNGPLLGQCGDTPDGTVGVPYGAEGGGSNLLASGGDPPYTFTQTGGIFPPGLTLTTSGADAGLISGTPTASGKFTFSILITDSSGATFTITCVISVCPGGSSGGSNNYAYYARM
jgi:hypothetical protein